ncbi:MAG: FMN-binding negative transcriptional regulator [Pseudomonadota bacterium]
MYVPKHFAAEDPDALLAKLAAERLAILVTVGADGALFATHLPMLWNAEKRMLEGHIARGNPHHTLPTTAPALVILPGAEAYVSPSLYPSKAEHGRVVPTWNYETVHVTGPLTWFDDATRLEGVVRGLTDRHEAGRDNAWSIDDAPRDYVEAMLRGIVGVEVRAENIEAKCKLSQNRSAADIEGVRASLESSGNPFDLQVANLLSRSG